MNNASAGSFLESVLTAANSRGPPALARAPVASITSASVQLMPMRSTRCHVAAAELISLSRHGAKFQLQLWSLQDAPRRRVLRHDIARALDADLPPQPLRLDQSIAHAQAEEARNTRQRRPAVL